MNRSSWIALVIAALLFGCGAGMVAHEALESDAVAQEQWTGQKWEYICDRNVNPSEMIYTDMARQRMNEFGSQGWELMFESTTGGGCICYKRPVQ